ncbi:glutaredoxin 3 [Rhodoblastus sp.]|uniref:glutaredoxin 3 n=1 Tax=Rhodoblastus sp. TaxID=1962975 RepID=UPI0035B2DBC7
MPKIVIYTKATCPYCIRAKMLLTEKGANFEEVPVDFDAPRRNEMIARAQGRSTVPQIFIGERHIGGCDDLFALDYAGQLDSLLAA